MGVVAQGAPVFRIGGDPGGISTRAAVMMDRANEFADIHAGLSSLTSDGWQGRTANHFRYKFNLQIKGWLDAQIAFSDASTAYQSYASTLLSAQSQCDEIRSRWEQGRNAVEQAQNNKADARSRAAAEGGTPMFDASCDEGPGRSTMAAAEDDFQTLVNQVNESGTLLINALNSGISKLPERTWMDAATRTLKSVYDGFVEATIDLIKLTWTLGGYAALYDFGRFICGHMTFDELHAKWVELPAETFVGLTTVLSENPEAFFEGLAKGLFDYDTLIDDPGRAFGHEIPDILITIATAGAGTGASAGSKGATRASKAARIGRALFKELTHISDIEDIAHLSKLAFRKIKRIGVHAVTSLSDIAENAAERLRRLKEAGHTGHPPLSGAPDNSPHIPSSGTSSSSSHGGLSTPAQGSHPAAGNTHTPSPAGPDSGADHGGFHQAGQGSNGHSGASSSHAATNTGGGAPNSEPPSPAPPKSEAPTTHSLSDTTQAPHAGADIADGKPHAADPTTPTHEADGSTDGSTGNKYREKYGSSESDASSHTTTPDGDGDKNPHHNLFNGNESSHSHHSAAGEHADAAPKAKDHSANGKANDAADTARHGDKTEADKPTSDKSHKEDDAAHHDGDKHPEDSDAKSDKDSGEHADAEPKAKDHSANGKADDAADSARHGDKTEADKPTSDKSHKEDDAAHHDGDEHPKDTDDKHTTKDEADTHKSDKDADTKSTKVEGDTHKSDKDRDGKSTKDESDTHKSDKVGDEEFSESERHGDSKEVRDEMSEHSNDTDAHHAGDSDKPRNSDNKPSDESSLPEDSALASPAPSYGESPDPTSGHLRPVDETVDALLGENANVVPATPEELAERSPKMPKGLLHYDDKEPPAHYKDGLGSYKNGAAITLDHHIQLGKGTHPNITTTSEMMRSEYIQPGTTKPNWRTDIHHGAIPGTERKYESIADLTADFNIDGIDRTGDYTGNFTSPMVNGDICAAEYRSTPLTNYGLPYHQYEFTGKELPPPGSYAEFSIAAPDHNSPGGAPQLVFMERQPNGSFKEMTIEQLLEDGYIEGRQHHKGTVKIPDAEDLARRLERTKHRKL